MDAIREWVEESPYARFLGVKLEQIDDSSARLRLPYQDENSNPGKALHGGCAASIGAIAGQAIARAADVCFVANGVIGKDLLDSGARRIEQVPMSVDTHLGAMRRADLAATLVAVGRLDEAVDEIEYLLSVPSFLTPAILEIEPRWRAVLDHPRLREVVVRFPL